jgi:hypothetical protein
MIWARVQSIAVQASSGLHTSIVGTLASPVTAGNLITIGYADHTATSVACIDNINGVSYAQVAPASNGGGNQTAVFWYVPPVGGAGFAITASWTNSAYGTLFINEWSFTPGFTITVDSFSANTGSTTAMSAANLAITGTDLVYAIGNFNFNGTWTAGSGFTLGNNLSNISGASVGGQEEYILNQSSSPVTPAMTVPNAFPWAFSAVAFKAASPSGKLFMPASLSLGAGGPFFNSAVNG